ncbi:MAG TPA: hypothetical protein VH500_12175 [Nitrososphaeraceae archaeon]
MTANYDLVKEEDKSFDVDYTICSRIGYIPIRLFEMSVDVNELIGKR